VSGASRSLSQRQRCRPYQAEWRANGIVVSAKGWTVPLSTPKGSVLMFTLIIAAAISASSAAAPVKVTSPYFPGWECHYENSVQQNDERDGRANSGGPVVKVCEAPKSHR
jgi:hypothetical protein